MFWVMLGIAAFYAKGADVFHQDCRDLKPRPKLSITTPTQFDAPPADVSTAISAVWANNGEDKVTQDELRASLYFGIVSYPPLCDGSPVINAVWDGTTIKQFGAKNEVVEFNLILEAALEAASNVTVTISDLTGPGGSVIRHTPPRSNADLFNWTTGEIELFYVRYLQETGMSTWGCWSEYSWSQDQLPAKLQSPAGPTGDWGSRPWANKYIPDIAVPMDIVPSFNIAAGNNQSVWADIYIPQTVNAGSYSGTITVAENGSPTWTIPVSLTVRNFMLPDLPNSKTMLGTYYSDIAPRYTGTYWPDPASPEGLMTIQVLQNHTLMAHRHKLSMCGDDGASENDAPDAYVSPSPGYVPALTGDLFTPANGYAGPGVGVGNNVYSIGNWWTTATQTTFQANCIAWESWFAANAPETERFVYLADEPTDFTQTAQWASWMQGTGLKSFATLGAFLLPTQQSTIPDMDIYCFGISSCPWGTTPGSAIDTSVAADETAIGPFPTVSASGDGTTATITFTAISAFSVSPFGTVTISGVTPSGYNGTYPVAASGPNSVSYLNTTTGAQTVAGTVTLTPGKEVWMYNCGRPGEGSVATDADGVDLRERPWGQYKKHIGRWHDWECTYYCDNQCGRGNVDVMNNIQTWGYPTSSDPALGNVSANNMNGNGLLFYPGTDAIFTTPASGQTGSNYGIPGPIASLRLKHLRRGVQDVDYIALAAAINPSAVNIIVNTMVPQVLWDVPCYGPNWTAPPISYSTDPDEWENARLQLANIIDSPAITTTSLPGGVTGVSYSQTLAVSDGMESCTWSVTSGTLPTGLNLSSSGVISGTPTATGISTFTVLVANGAGATATQTFSIIVNNSISNNISGAVALSGGGNLQGVTVSLTFGGNTVGSATTDSSGDYTFTGVPNGNYTLTPTMSGYIFNPINLSPTVNGANVQSQNFTATLNTYSISGTITLNGQGLSDVTVSYGGNNSVMTDGSGAYSISGVVNGSYTLTPSLAGYTFNPASQALTISGGNATQNFSATIIPPSTFSIIGTITLNGQGLNGVTVNYGGNNSVTTNGSGAYIISGVANGSYSLTPSLAGYTFNPTNQTISISGGNATQNFSATVIPPSTFSISGTITLNGQGLSGVTVNYGGNNFVTTNGAGVYIISGAANGSYTLTPALTGYTFTPTTLQATVNSANLTGENFTVTINPPASVATPAFSPLPGAYNSTKTVTISCATSGVTIYYTTDGSTPTASSTQYSTPISVTASTQLQAIAIEAGTKSLIISGVYNIAGSSSYVPDTDNDTDGNGYPDEIKTALGVSLTNSSATPLNMQAGITSQALTLSKLSVKLNFAKTAGNDAIMVSGLLQIPSGFAANAQTVVVDVGGVVKVFTLDSKGKGHAAKGYPTVTSAANDHFSLKFKSVKGNVDQQTGTFTAQFNKGTFASSFADVGLLGSASVKDAARTVPVIILFNNQMCQASQAVHYTATANKTGVALWASKP
jgi:hypothetical protein